MPQQGTALDLGGGAGRNAIWLAQRGLAVSIWDISAAGLAIAHERAAAIGVALTTREIDLQAGESLPTASFDLVLSVCYLNRRLLAHAPALMAPGGTLIVIQPTERNLERHEKPPQGYLLVEQELPELISGLEILHYEEGWLADERHDAVLVAGKPRSMKQVSA
jgi:SAM-dependent methyltransferase